MPIFSLPSKFGMGSFGMESYDFIDFLASSNQGVWQILPLVQTGFGNSPYSSVCSESFNPYFIGLDLLKKQKLLTKSELEFALVKEEKHIDYGALYAVRFPLLKKAFSRFDRNNLEFVSFKKQGEYYDYALYMAIKEASGNKHFYEWADPLKYREDWALKQFSKDYFEEIEFWQFIQFIAKKQWLELKSYANQKGVSIMGDMPLYVALDSVDVWVNPTLYKLDDNFAPSVVAGVPPDYFCKEGQLWGNPVYDYDQHKKDNFSWWTNRLKKALSIYDYVRIDHFRGLDRYYEVKADAPNAMQGEWVKVPSIELFNAIHEKVDKTRIIAEDLGIIDDGVRELLSFTGYPGMKILSFAFDGQGDNLYLPKNVIENCVYYTGTHDNDTLMGLIQNASEWDKNNIVRGVTECYRELGEGYEYSSDQELMDKIIALGFNSKANLFIMPYQDLLKFGSDYRINEPSTVKEQNWAVRFSRENFTKKHLQALKTLTKKSNRI